MSNGDFRGWGWELLKNNFNTRQRCTGTHTSTLPTPSEDTHVNVAQVKIGQKLNTPYRYRLLQRINPFRRVGNAGVCVNMIYHGPRFSGAGTCSLKKGGLDRNDSILALQNNGKITDDLSAIFLFHHPRVVVGNYGKDFLFVRIFGSHPYACEKQWTAGLTKNPNATLSEHPQRLRTRARVYKSLLHWQHLCCLSGQTENLIKPDFFKVVNSSNFAFDFDKTRATMGGFGSGSWYRWDSKRTTESQHRIDVRLLKKWGHLDGSTYCGSWSWSRCGKQTSSINYRVNSERMVLSYRNRPRGGEWESVEQTIHFDRLPCHYGGHRYWFLCPRCYRRVAVLYGAEKYFYCRHCYGLTYASQQERFGDRMMRKARNIRKQMDPDNTVFDLFPFKPKGMHWRTYDRLRLEAVRAETIGFGVMERNLDGMRATLEGVAKKLRQPAANL